MKRRLYTLTAGLLAGVLLTMGLTACGEGGPGNSEIVVNKELPSFEFPSKTVQLMANWTGSEADVEKLRTDVKKYYGLDLEVLSVGWEDIPQKLASLVLTNQAPDMVLKRSDLDDFPSHIVNELVQPIDDYLDISHPLFSHLADAYQATLWDGKHYLGITEVGTGAAVYYNKKMLEDNGQPLPWDLYKNGEWTWDKLKEIALAMKVEKDGTIEQYGFALHRPYPWAYTVGKPFGSLDGTNKTITNNIQDPDFARAMNYLADMIINDKVCPSRIDGALDLFRREQTPILIAERIYQMPEVMELAKAGNLGIAPMPRDPEKDTHYVRGSAEGWFVPVGAKNPQGAMAVLSVSVYNSTNDQKKAEKHQLLKEQCSLTDENIEQLETAEKSGVTPVLETAPWIGYDTVWLMVGNSVNWTTQVDSDLPRINAKIAELFEKQEYDAPTGPKVIDDFEKYGTDTKKAIAQYVPRSGGDAGAGLYLVTDDVKSGKYAVRLDYNHVDKKWCGVERTVKKSWNGNNTMRLWIKGDGKPVKVAIQFVTTANSTWTYEFQLTGSEWKQLDIPLSEFKLPEWNTDDVKLDLTSIASYNISVGTENVQKGSLWLDKIEVISK